jgi:ABC-type oligopeptide transport system substrate-binding subunit
LLRKLLIALVGIVLFCTAAAASENVLYWNLGGSPNSIDPSYAAGIASRQVDHALFAGLTDIDDDSLQVIPRLATSWKTEDGGLSWTFYLRKDAIWSDGTPVTAHDITFAIQRTLDPANPNPLAHELHIIQGAEEYNTGLGSARDIGVTAIDNHTIRFTLVQRNDCFPLLVSSSAFYPQPRSIVEEYKMDWILPEHIVTNGPYVLGQWIVGDRVVLYKTHTYYGADEVAIDQIYCYMIADEGKSLTMYEQGVLDVVSIGEETANRLEADPLLKDQLHIYTDQIMATIPDCLPKASHSYAQLSKPYLVRSYALFGIEKWENWDISR